MVLIYNRAKGLFYSYTQGEDGWVSLADADAYGEGDIPAGGELVTLKEARTLPQRSDYGDLLDASQIAMDAACFEARMNRKRAA